MKFTKQEIKNLKRLCDAVSKVNDKVNLRPGDWFAFSNANKLYKVVEIKKNSSYPSYSKTQEYISVPEVVVETFELGNDMKSVKSRGKEQLVLRPKLTAGMTVFNSSKEAISWFIKRNNL